MNSHSPTIYVIVSHISVARKYFVKEEKSIELINESESLEIIDFDICDLSQIPEEPKLDD